MATQSVTFDTGHEEMIHDAQLDYYGKKMASASSDRTIKIFEVIGDQPKPNAVATLTGHDGPVWQVSWAHPKFGILLASCSYDGKVCVWKEQQLNQWTKIYENVPSPQASVNSIAWAPDTFGLVLAAASSDGSVVIYTHRDDQSWDIQRIMAHNGGCNSVSWGPDVAVGGSLGAQSPVLKKIVTGGCDNCVKIWGFDENNHQCPWGEVSKFAQEDNKHSDWVRDVAWAPSLGLLSNTIASCSEDKTVVIWSEENGVWRKSKVLDFPHKIWRCSWSPMGNILAVSQGDNKVSLWKETIDGEWKNLSTVEDEAKE